MAERLTWDQIQKKYPDEWVGLTDVKYIDDDGISVESAIMKYIDKTKGELTRMVLKGEIVIRSSGNVMKQYSLNLDKQYQRPVVLFGNGLTALLDTGAYIPVWSDE